MIETSVRVWDHFRLWTRGIKSTKEGKKRQSKYESKIQTGSKLEVKMLHKLKRVRVIVLSKLIKKIKEEKSSNIKN